MKYSEEQKEKAFLTGEKTLPNRIWLTYIHIDCSYVYFVGQN